MSNWLPDLAGRAGPIYRRVVDALENDVKAGRLAPGTRLPTHRDLAWRLKVTVGTVARAYAEAERLGLLAGEVGRGTFVRAPGAEPSLAEMLSAKAADGETVIDMAINRPVGDAGAPAVAAALRAIAGRADLSGLLGYNLDGATLRHRAAGSRWIAVEGLEVPPERVTVTASGQQAIIAALAAVSRPGDTVLAEEFTYPGLKSAASLLDRRLAGVVMDAEGLVPEAVERALVERGASVLYTIPTVQNPSTTTLSVERRKAIAEIARRQDAFIIEDGVYSFLEAEAPPPIATFAPERTLYITSMAKNLCPGLRIGFVAAPEGLVARVAAGINATSVMVPALLAEVAAMLIEDGTVAASARAQREECSARRRLACAKLGETACQGRSAFNLWLPLPPFWRSQDFATEARRNGVAVTPSESCAVGKPRYEAVRISISAPKDANELASGLRILAGLLRVPPDAACVAV